MAIKDFFNSIKSGVKKAGDKLDNAVDIQKLKHRISKIEDEMDDICFELGKTVITAVLEEKDCSDALAQAKEAYLAKKAEKDALDAERREKEGAVLCENCGFEVEEDHDFCPKCGAKVVRPEPVVEEIVEEETASEESTDPEEPSEEATNE